MKQDHKNLLLSQLRRTPVIQLACEKASISRATYYRWREADHEFAKDADNAIREGEGLVNDIAESQLMSAIKNQNLGAIRFWLNHHHPKYTTRIEVKSLDDHDDKLTPAQQELIRKALAMASLSTNNENNGNGEQPKPDTSGAVR